MFGLRWKNQPNHKPEEKREARAETANRYERRLVQQRERSRNPVRLGKTEREIVWIG